MTNVRELIGKELFLEVATGVELHIKVLSESEVEYQFIGTDDGTKDALVLTKLEVAFDDIDSIEDYSFTDGIASRFFLFQFEEKINN
jgi:hypothetical protein